MNRSFVFRSCLQVLARAFFLSLFLLGNSTLDTAWCNDSQIFIIGTAVKVRAEPTTKGNEVGLVKFGEILPMLGKTDKPVKIGEMEDVWYQVTLPDSKTGWLFGGFATSYNAARSYEDLAAAFNRRLTLTDTTRDEALAVFTWVIDQSKNASSDDDKLFYGLYQTLFAAYFVDCLMAKGTDSEKAIKDPAVKPLAGTLLYHELAGGYIADMQLLWKLHDHYATTAVSDLVARQITDVGLLGESEGYPPALVDRREMTKGGYLKRHPEGKYVDEVLTEIDETLDFIMKDESGSLTLPSADAEEFKKQLEGFKTLINTTNGSAKSAISRKIDAIAKQVVIAKP